MNRLIVGLVGLSLIAGCSSEGEAEPVVTTVTQTPPTVTVETTVTETVTATLTTAVQDDAGSGVGESSGQSLCHDAYSRFSDKIREDLDTAVTEGHLSPVNLWFAASTFGSISIGDLSGRVADAVGDFNGAAMLLTADGVKDMTDDDAQDFMQSYYDMREACRDITAWN